MSYILFDELETEDRPGTAETAEVEVEPKLTLRRRAKRGIAWAIYRWLRGKGWRTRINRLRWNEPFTSGTFSSSRQAVPLNPALVGTRTPSYGALAGRDLLTGQPLTGSVQALYAAGKLTAPMVAILGGIGTRKSTLAKTLYGLRPIALGTTVATFDRKVQRQNDGGIAGEYLRLAQVISRSTVITLNRDRSVGTRINPLDPTISAMGTDSTVGQDDLLRMLAESALGKRLTPEQGNALAAAHRAALETARNENRVAVLPDVVNSLYAPTEAAIPGPHTPHPVLAERGIVDLTRVTEWGLPVALAFERFLQGDLSGMLDGETAGPNGTDVDLDAKLLVIDTSALPEGSEALGLMMAIISTWLMNRWARIPGFKHLIIEEAYAADQLGAVPRILRALVKRSRGVGAAVIGVFHHISDVTSESPLYALIKEAGVVHVFSQDKMEDARQVVEMFGLPHDLVPVIQTLPPGANVWMRGSLPPTLMRQFRTPLEAWVTDTDDAMRRQPDPDEPTGQQDG